jgi:hypothetical protein
MMILARPEDNMADQSKFQITYSGPALDANEMDVRELTPALVAVADLLEEANLIIGGGGSRVSVNVHGSFRTGSFGIDFTVIHDIYQNVMSILNSPGVAGASNLLQLLGLRDVGKGLIGFLKKLKNREIERVEKLGKDGIRIHITREETVDIDPRVLDLYKSARIRNALDKVIAEPLGRIGIDDVEVKAENATNSLHIKKDEREYFTMPLLEDETLGENVSEAYLHVVSLSFKTDNKWKFARGEAVFFAEIADADFLNKINRNEARFSKDDILKVELYAKDVLTERGISTEYRVLRVLEHRSAARQLKLPETKTQDSGEPGRTPA